MSKIYRVLAIDYGEKRVGIALSDPLQIIANPFEVLANDEQLIENINKIINEKDVRKVIMGLPCNLEGKDTIKTREVREFTALLQNHISIPIQYWDERYTTVAANEAIKKKGYDVMQARKVVDKVAAAILLQSYLDS